MKCLRTEEMLVLDPKSSSLCLHYESDCASAGYTMSGRYLSKCSNIKLVQAIDEMKREHAQGISAMTKSLPYIINSYMV